MTDVAVIIPFFQKTKGILERALNSVLKQTAIHHVNKVIIVDDGSCVAPEDDLTTFAKHPCYKKISVIRQKNAGPGAARNTGLNNLPRGTEYVAFLDSDDEWAPRHLEHGLEAFNLGCDLYFADWQRPEDDVSVLKSEFFLNTGKHSLVNAKRAFFQYSSNMFNDLIKFNFVATSTLMYNFKKLPEIRFCEYLFNGQDIVFMLDILQKTNTVIFCTELAVKMGHGVNIWAGAKWGTIKMIDRTFNEIQLTHTIMKRYKLSNDIHCLLKNRLANRRFEIVKNILHFLRHGKKFNFVRLVRKAFCDPAFFLFFPPLVFKIFFLFITQCDKKNVVR